MPPRSEHGTGDVQKDTRTPGRSGLISPRALTQHITNVHQNKQNQSRESAPRDDREGRLGPRALALDEHYARVSCEEREPFVTSAPIRPGI